MSKEKPILFSSAMVRAILENRKTQTRRVIALPSWTVADDVLYMDEVDPPWPHAISGYSGCMARVGCPYGVPGDRLVVKEATWLWCERRPNGTTKKGRPKWRYVWQENTPPVYVADHPAKPVDDIPVTNARGNRLMWKYKTARFMPKKAARTWLEITDVRVQRLQEISLYDAQQEGVDVGPLSRSGAVNAFYDLWDSINGKSHPWASNPWIWALTFRRVHA